MDWIALLTEIFEVCVLPLLGVLAIYLTNFIRSKCEDLTEKSKNETMDKYIYMLGETISTCVIATKQTYVEALKKDKIFDANAQKEALQMTLNAVMNILTDEAKTYLTEAYGDLNAYIVQKIEAEVNMTK